MSLPAAESNRTATTRCTSRPETRHRRSFFIRDVRDDECAALGELLVDVYSQLPGFPSRREQPSYYALIRNVGALRTKPAARVLVAVSGRAELLGGVVYFGDMAQYSAGGIATSLSKTSGIRLLGVDQRVRGEGVGRALTLACIDLARNDDHSRVVLHTTAAMKTAWRLYEALGFERDEELDFRQEGLAVYGFCLDLSWGASR
jgi:ribosomal protein S18 acetylase RimI-like enzyme